MACLLLSEREMLFLGQEQSLWLPDASWREMLTIYPGGWLSIAGCFLTQFFYYPALGIALLTVAWISIALMQQHIFRLRGWNMLVSLVTPMLLLTCIVQTGYWIYYMKLPGHLWVPTLGILLAHLVALLANYMKGWTKLPLLIITAWLGYLWCGAWSFLALALIVFSSFKPLEETLSKANKIALWSLPIVTIACIFIVPHLAYYCVFDQTMFDNIYVAGMPSFRHADSDCAIYRLAYYLLFASLALPLLIARLNNHSPRNQRWNHILLGTVLACSCLFVQNRWNKDRNFHAECAMSNAVGQQDWKRVLDISREGANDTLPPTRAMVMMKNLALFRLGRFADEFLQYPEGARQQDMEDFERYGFTVRLTQIAGKTLYFNYGKLNFAYRWCMEDAVEFGWRVNELKLMALCAMLKGEDTVAHKYIDLLKKTLYHKEWAEHYEALIGHPDKIRKQPELEQICYLKEYGDRLDGDNTLVELYLLQTFASGHGADPVYQEMTLNSALLMKDIDLFWPRFWEYASRHAKDSNFHMPRYYQEAAYLYGHLENKVDISTLPFDQSVCDSYDRFMQYNARPDINPLSEKEKAEKFRPLFGDTFYYFYFLVRNQKTN